MGGATLASNEIIAGVRVFAHHSDPAVSPFNSWILSKSLEMVSIPMELYCQSVLEIANHLNTHSEALSLRYLHLASHLHYQLALKQMRLVGGGIVSLNWH